MISLEEFQKENEQILNLCEVLNVLLDEKKLCNNTIVYELADRFLAQIDNHLSHEVKSVYSDLLAEHTSEGKQLANQFLTNTHELQRICSQYKKTWKGKSPNKNYENFCNDTLEITKLMCKRVLLENDKIFPHFQSVA